ncbi:hypothetical protein AAEU42_04145 [Pseudoflavonifractor phocaeensis]|uniref:hypothetical protein n=1 Tax=Pseudoflavonifractor phocaeensis TaxID=1870988 RepID=UPI00313E4224
MALLWSVAQEEEGGMYMSQNQTERFGLHLWEPEDNFLREEFNENFLTLDKVLGAKSEVVFGSYTGTGTVNRVISLGFTPKCVILVNDRWRLFSTNNPNDVEGGIFFSETDIPNFKIVTNGFRVSNEESYGGSTNNARIHYYIAFR